MCWSGEASTVLAAVGLAGTGYAAYKGTPKELWLPLGYFSLMEALQAYTYSIINDCGNPANQAATLLGYLHIAFQPFFINMLSMFFIPKPVAQRIAPFVYVLCFAAAIVMVMHLYPIPQTGSCKIGRPLCASALCSVSGNWHIAWNVPLNGWHEACSFDMNLWLFPIKSVYLPYVIPAFLIPFLYGSWRLTIYQMLAGPVLAKFLTSNQNEWPAVWCLLSIGILLLVVKTPLRAWMHVKRWPLWGALNRPA